MKTTESTVEHGQTNSQTNGHQQSSTVPTNSQTNGALPPDWSVFDKAFRYEQWMDESLCAQVGPEAWFPEKGGATRQAKAVCWRCPVREECLAYALANTEPFGIWGGLSWHERRRLTGLPVTAESAPDLAPDVAPAGPPRVCRTCGVEKPLTEFYRDRSGPGGRKTDCRGCRSEAKRAEPVPRKVCRECGVSKARTEFYGDGPGRGVGVRCIECTRGLRRAAYAEQRDRAGAA